MTKLFDIVVNKYFYSLTGTNTATSKNKELFTLPTQMKVNSFCVEGGYTVHVERKRKEISLGILNLPSMSYFEPRFKKE